MKVKNRVYEVGIYLQRTEKAIMGVAATSKEEALNKAKVFDFIDISFYESFEPVKYYWEEAKVVEAEL